MNPRLSFRWLAPAFLLILALLACSFGAQPTETPAPTATSKPAPTEEPPTEAPEPTEEPRATLAPKPTEAAEPSGEAPFSLAADPYLHSSGAFSINLPEGWEVDERSDGLFTSAPDGVGSIDVSFMNLGVELDATSLDNYIAAIEANWFGSFANYAQTAYEPQSDGSIGVLKDVELSDGTPKTVFSYYEQHGTVVFQQDFWVDGDQYDAYLDAFLEVANSMQTDEAAGAAAPLYEFVYTFTGPASLFEFNVPYAWTYDQSVDETVQVDTWTSPDKQSVIENIAYDDGTVISKTQAAAFALSLLKEFYASDIVITDDQVQQDGSERLTWRSPGGGYSGVSFFETRGTTALLLTWNATESYYDLYFPVWDSVVQSYTIPE